MFLMINKVVGVWVGEEEEISLGLYRTVIFSNLPASRRTLAVPAVAKRLNPISTSCFAFSTKSAFARLGPIDKRILCVLVGILNRVAFKARRYASLIVFPKHATSPVEDISTPKVGSAP